MNGRETLPHVDLQEKHDVDGNSVVGSSNPDSESGSQINNGESTKVCAHRWVFGKANGATSRGVCKNCGDVTRQKNALDGVSEGRLSGLGRNKKR